MIADNFSLSFLQVHVPAQSKLQEDAGLNAQNRIVSKSSFACRYTRAVLLLLQQHIITRTHNPKTMQDHIQVNS